MAQISNKWIIFQLREDFFGIEAEHVQEMVIADGIHENPLAPPHIRGVMRLRENVFPVVDLRVCFDIGSKKKEIDDFVRMLDDREQDHVRWLEELRASVEERREFKLTTDPHQCAFGKWYDTYVPETALMRMQLEKFDKPHRAIHALAHGVTDRVHSGDTRGALSLVERAWSNELAAMVRLFGDTKDLVRSESNEIALVFFFEGRRIALLVDSVVEILDIPVGDVQRFDVDVLGARTSYIHGIANVHGAVKVLVDMAAIAEITPPGEARA